MAALMTRRNRPSVKIVIGRVSTIMTGRITAFTIPRMRSGPKKRRASLHLDAGHELRGEPKPESDDQHPEDEAGHDEPSHSRLTYLKAVPLGQEEGEQRRAAKAPSRSGPRPCSRTSLSD